LQHVNSDHDFDVAFIRLTQLQVGGLAVGAGAFFTARAERLAALLRLPVILKHSVHG